MTMISRADTANLYNMPSISEDTYSGASVADASLPWLAEKLASVTVEDSWKTTKFETTPIVRLDVRRCMLSLIQPYD